jgi:hypothetical protein
VSTWRSYPSANLWCSWCVLLNGEDALALVDDIGSRSVIPSPDSTLGAGLESMKYMQRAVLYARVSTDAQQKEGTIESQVAELKRQIAAAGHVLIKEYIDVRVVS